MATQGTANPYHAGSNPVRCSINFYATLAQMVEHLTCNEDVVSSILTGGSISYTECRGKFNSTLNSLCRYYTHESKVALLNFSPW